GEEAEEERRLACPRDEDERPPADVVGEMSVEVAGTDADDGADEEDHAERRLADAEPADGPEADEAPDARAGHRADEPDREHGPQLPVDLAAPDEAEEAGEEPHHPSRPRRNTATPPTEARTTGA